MLARMSAGGPRSDAGNGFVAELRRLWWVPIAAALAVGVAAYLLASTVDRRYESVALIQVNNANLAEDVIGLDTNFKPIQNVLGEIPPQVHQRSVARRAAVSLRPGLVVSPDEVLAATSVSVDQSNGLVEVKADSSSASEAAAIANALADEYVRRRNEHDYRRVQQARVELEEIAAKQTASSGSDPAAASDLSSLNDQIEQLRLTEKLHPKSVEVVRAATPAADPSGVAPGLVGIAGAIVGALIGLGAVGMRARRDDQIATLGELEQALEAPVMARIPQSRSLARRDEVSGLSAREREPFRLLLALLQEDPAALAIQTVAVTSPIAGGGASTVSWYLAAMSAAGGVRTILMRVDAEPAEASADEGTGRRGISALLTGADIAETTTRAAVGEGHFVDVLTLSSAADSMLISEPGVADGILERVESAYDLVVVETPPLLFAADAVPIVRKADGVIAVCRRGVVSRQNAALFREAITGLEARLFGIAAIGYGSDM